MLLYSLFNVSFPSIADFETWRFTYPIFDKSRWQNLDDQLVGRRLVGRWRHDAQVDHGTTQGEENQVKKKLTTSFVLLIATRSIDSCWQAVAQYNCNVFET